MAAPDRALWAFDFDGVICDSVGESSISAWQASSRVWPDFFAEPQTAAREQDVLEKMRVVRPVIETGYENIVQVRCLLEGTATEDILDNWHTILPDKMRQWSLDRAELVKAFGGYRDEWMAEDIGGWLNTNTIYPGAAEMLHHAVSHHETYIVTTKQARFTEALLRDKAGVDLPSERVISTAETGQPKSEVLLELGARHGGLQNIHFVEDKLSTLEKVMKEPRLDGWSLYLVDWGYNTAPERQRAAETGRISVTDAAALCKELGL